MIGVGTGNAKTKVTFLYRILLKIQEAKTVSSMHTRYLRFEHLHLQLVENTLGTYT